MEIIRASVMGFCMGVRRAVEVAEKTSLEYKDKCSSMFTLGPLIHNPAVMESLRQKGVEVLDSECLDKVEEGSPVVIRAHGTSPETIKLLEEKGAIVIDATCPRVKQSQNRVKEWSEKGYSVIVAGDKNHGEVTGISGYFNSSFGGKFFVVQSEEEAAEISVDEKTMLLAQTTFSIEKYNRIKQILLEKNRELKIFDSICPATRDRQKALADLTGKADAILIVGGKNSANTKRLLESAKKIFKLTALIEKPEEIPEEFFGLRKIAVTAGASTPDWIIEKIIEKLMCCAV